ncbi:MAG: tRNA lysidine(34) synthetase TilS [bacterium]
MLNKFKRTIKENNLISPGDKIVVAVSGGPDSMCLLKMLQAIAKEFNLKLCVAHFNHKMRKLASDKDEEFVAQFAKQNKLPFFSQSSHNKLKGETTARKSRYKFYRQAKKHFQADKVALGHNLNDNVETIIQFFLRGSGPLGLAGIPITRDFYIRPLREISRKEILQFLKSSNTSYRLDASNQNVKISRNRIRHELIPLLKTYNPNLIFTLNQASKAHRLAVDTISEIADKEIIFLQNNNSLHFYIDEIIVDRIEFKNLKRGLQNAVLHNLLKRLLPNLSNITAKHVLAIQKCFASNKVSGKIELPAGLHCEWGYDKIAISYKPKKEVLSNPEFVDLEKKSTFSEFNLEVLPSQQKAVISKFVQVFDKDKTGDKLLIRTWQPGDTIHPRGMKGKKKLQDIFTDLKIPKFLRNKIPVLTTQSNNIVWIVGIKADRKFLVGKQTKKYLTLKVKPFKQSNIIYSYEKSI